MTPCCQGQRGPVLAVSVERQTATNVRNGTDLAQARVYTATATDTNDLLSITNDVIDTNDLLSTTNDVSTLMTCY